MERVDKIVEKGTGKVSAKVGKGLAAGIMGTVAITASQMIMMKITGRGPSNTPAEAAGKVLDIEPAGEGERKEENKQKFTNIIHFIYGTSWGAARGVLASAGIKGIPATAIHFGAVWGTAMIMLPALKVAPPVRKWGIKEIAKDAFHHAVYAVAAGLVFDRLNKVKA